LLAGAKAPDILLASLAKILCNGWRRKENGEQGEELDMRCSLPAER